jgi:hypothetical protein
VFHGIIAALLWILYAYYWSIVGRRPLNPSTVVSLASLGVLAGLTMIILVVWIFHNIRIARKYQRRTVRPPAPRGAVKDYVGRWIVCDQPELLLTANYIEVDIKRTVTDKRTVEEKIFRVVRAK